MLHIRHVWAAGKSPCFQPRCRSPFVGSRRPVPSPILLGSSIIGGAHWIDNDRQVAIQSAAELERLLLAAALDW
jgi:hypothetical protein